MNGQDPCAPSELVVTLKRTLRVLSKLTIAGVDVLDLKQHIANIPDFPRPGILFRDITPLLREHFVATVQALDELFNAQEWARFDAIAGIESRGFILAAALAERHHKGFVPIRKQGKLPPPVVDVAYTLEYGVGVLEMQRGTGRVLIVDDVVATSGTMRAGAELCERAGYQVRGLATLIDLKLVAKLQWKEVQLRAALTYD